MIPFTCTAEEALAKLRHGNEAFLTRETPLGDVSPRLRLKTWEQGQKPYAIVICCSDSRVLPESLFCAGIGELFVIRVAGNVIDNHQLGSIEYAAEHLGCPLILVLGHDRCGAVDAAIRHDPDGYIRFITDEIREAIGEERDPLRASCLNVRHSLRRIEESLAIRAEEEQGLRLLGAVYELQSGRVRFLDEEGSPCN